MNQNVIEIGEWVQKVLAQGEQVLKNYGQVIHINQTGPRNRDLVARC